MTCTQVDNTQDVLDSRDVIARLEELESDRERAKETAEEDGGVFNPKKDFPDEEELQALKALVEEAEGSPDWPYGETLIRDSYFTEYAQQLAEDCGMVNDNAKWPNNCIDWERAAEELQADYFSVDFGGVEYWIRA